MDKIIGQMHDLGIRWLRINFHWNNHEPEKGKFDWDGGSFPMGTFTDLAYKHNMHVMAELTYTARWASSRAHDERGGAIDTGAFWESVAPKDFADWENYCRKAAERLKAKSNTTKSGTSPGPRRITKISTASGGIPPTISSGSSIRQKGVKTVDPRAKICAAGFRGVDIGVISIISSSGSSPA